MLHENNTSLFNQVDGFEWDLGNKTKNWLKHNVTIYESEEIFFNQPIYVQSDELHSSVENRYFLLGITDLGRYLFTVFTIRHHKIRIISIRDMNKKERGIYEKIKKNTEI